MGILIGIHGHMHAIPEYPQCNMGVIMTSLHDFHARVLAVLITLFSRGFLLRTVLSYMILL